MNNSNGWIKLHRSIQDWEWYSDMAVKSVWIELLIRARHEDGRYRGVKMPAGSLLIGTDELAVKIGASRQQVRTALKKLESTGEIHKKSTNKGTLVTIANWELYQVENELLTSNQPASNQQATSNQPASNQQSTTNKNVRKKECKNERINTHHIISIVPDEFGVKEGE